MKQLRRLLARWRCAWLLARLQLVRASELLSMATKGRSMMVESTAADSSRSGTVMVDVAVVEGVDADSTRSGVVETFGDEVSSGFAAGLQSMQMLPKMSLLRW